MRFELQERLIQLDSAHNVRHVGGYPAAGGGWTRRDVIRAASLSKLTDAGVRALAEMGVRTVVDLRSAGERERDKTPELEPHGITHIHAPVFEEDGSPQGLPAEFAGFKVMYREFLDTGMAAYATLFEALAASDSALLYHCAVGKDRTGVATMLLLDLAGVHDDWILEDYSHSAELLQPVYARWEAALRDRNEDPEKVKPHQTSNPEDIADALGYLRERWCGAAAYLREAGLAATTITRLRARIVE